MNALLYLVITVIDLYMWVVIIQVILSWLVAFNVVNTGNQIVYTVGNFLYRLTEPVLGRIRRVLPDLGGLDISPVILILALVFLKNLLIADIAPALR